MEPERAQRLLQEREIPCIVCGSGQGDPLREVRICLIQLSKLPRDVPESQQSVGHAARIPKRSADCQALLGAGSCPSEVFQEERKLAGREERLHPRCEISDLALRERSFDPVTAFDEISPHEPEASKLTGQPNRRVRLDPPERPFQRRPDIVQLRFQPVQPHDRS